MFIIYLALHIAMFCIDYSLARLYQLFITYILDFCACCARAFPLKFQHKCAYTCSVRGLSYHSTGCPLCLPTTRSLPLPHLMIPIQPMVHLYGGSPNPEGAL